MAMIELQVTKDGIIDPEGRFPLMKLQDANQLLGLLRDDELVLNASDDLSRAEHGRDCRKLDSVIEISKGRIRWGTWPSDLKLGT